MAYQLTRPIASPTVILPADSRWAPAPQSSTRFQLLLQPDEAAPSAALPPAICLAFCLAVSLLLWALIIGGAVWLLR